MKIQDHKVGAAVVVEVAGRLDSVTSSELEKEILSQLQSGENNLLIDFAGLDYISSAGLRVLLMAAKKAKWQAAGSCWPTSSITSKKYLI